MSELNFPASWEAVRLQELARARMGKTILKKELTESGVPVYSAGASTEPWGFLEGSNVTFGLETLVISARGNIGSPKRPRFAPFVCTQTTIACSAYLTDTVGWLHWFLTQFDYSTKSSQTTIPMLRTSDVDSFHVPLPPLNEQKRIFAKIEELFSEVDAGEESLRKARRQLGVYRQSLLKEAFEGKLTATWREQNPQLLETGEQLITRIQAERESSKDSEATSRGSRKGCAEMALDSQLVRSLPQLPEFWRWTALGNLTRLITKGSSPKWQGFDYTGDASGVLFVTSENVRSGFLDLARPKYLGLGFNKVQAKSLLQDGDVLLNIVGASIGRAAVFRGDAVANINQAVALIRLTHFLNRQFLTHHLNSSRMYQLVTSKAVDVARANFSLADVNEIPVPLCSLAEQQEIVRLLDEQFTVIEQNEREIDTALKRSEALRQSILKNAFSGQLVAQDPADEPAGVLLERIRKEREGAVVGKKRSDRSGQSAGSGKSLSESGGSDRSLPRPAPGIGEDFFPEIAAAKPRKPKLAGTPGKTDLQAGLVALAIAAHESGREHLGHVKAEKIVHLCDVIARLQLDRHPVKDAAGPNDFPQAKKVEHRAKMQGWFTVKKKPGAKAYTYQRGRNFDRLVHDTETRLGPRLQTIRDLMGDLAAMSWQEAELVATVHAAWNNLHLAGVRQPTEEAIVKESRDNWHPDKLKIPRERFFDAIAWIEGAGVIPEGTGLMVPGKPPGAGRKRR